MTWPFGLFIADSGYDRLQLISFVNDRMVNTSFLLDSLLARSQPYLWQTQSTSYQRQIFHSVVFYKRICLLRTTITTRKACNRFITLAIRSSIFRLPDSFSSTFSLCIFMEAFLSQILLVIPIGINRSQIFGLSEFMRYLQLPFILF